jgi:hypothetical protein
VVVVVTVMVVVVVTVMVVVGRWWLSGDGGGGGGGDIDGGCVCSMGGLVCGWMGARQQRCVLGGWVLGGSGGLVKKQIRVRLCA